MILFLRPLKRCLEKFFGIRIMKSLPRGLDFISDIKSISDVMTVFDVGANVGQSAIPYSINFNDAKIYCFEPSRATFEELVRNTKKIPAIQAVNLAVGSELKEMNLLYGENSEISRLMDDKAVTEEPYEKVCVITLDGFCEKYKIERISLLKVDTEGFDLEVLKGASRLLAAGNIDVVYVEAGISSLNDRHVPFREVEGYMLDYGYFIFGIYEQTHEWVKEKPYLRRVDVAFISPRLAKKRYI